MRSLMLAVGLLASVSLAQQKKPERPVQRVDIDSTDLIRGERGNPLGDIYARPPKVKFDCLIQVRMKMDDKLRESVHEM